MNPTPASAAAELDRLAADTARQANWKRWGPYLSERQWGTVREDYSPGGECWTYLTHEQARSRAYRWGEDGLLGITDRECRLCFALALWNEKDPILKERLFGLTSTEGNHGEDVKELYYYLDSTPTHSYLKALYKYPQAAYPYDALVSENARRDKLAPEFELLDTGVFNDNRYFDVQAEYAKQSPEDILVRLTLTNRGPEAAPLHVLPTLWFRNSWTWGGANEADAAERLRIEPVKDAPATWTATHPSLGSFVCAAGPGPGGAAPAALFTENETDHAAVSGEAAPDQGKYTKDAFHRHVVKGEEAAVNPERFGSKAAFHYRAEILAGESVTLRLRLGAADAVQGAALDLGGNTGAFDAVFTARQAEADAFYAAKIPAGLSDEERRVARQAYAGVLWSKQFYYYQVAEWLAGDPNQPKPPAERFAGRNHDWLHVVARDVLSMPDKWEYPWFAAWDLAFHCLPLARVDPQFSKEQLLLLTREWYLHPSGQMAAYEFKFGDVNPPVHGWAAWHVYLASGEKREERDGLFLERVFQKLVLNFNWWINRKDALGNNLFSGGFLGLDNIGVFDRSAPLPGGVVLEQADGTAWMGSYCAVMLCMAVELAQTRPAYEDMASTFFLHFVNIIDAVNTMGGKGLWNEEEGFYYDQLRAEGHENIDLKVRSIVGLFPAFAAYVLKGEDLVKLPAFRKRLDWFLRNKRGLASHVARKGEGDQPDYFLAIPTRERLERVLRYALDESEFLSPHGLRAVSRYHLEHPYNVELAGKTMGVDYVPGEGNSGMFGGNSNWRGPVWFPVNYLFLEALQRFHQFYGDDFKVECPVGSGKMLNLREVSRELARRLASIFLPDAQGRRPCHGEESRYAQDPAWKDLLLFNEYFHGDTGRGVGASHQTGWTALVTACLEQTAPVEK